MGTLGRRALGLATAALAGPALAQPRGSLRIVVPFPPGGSTDAAGRLAAQQLQQRLGTTVIVDNRPGANGFVGAEWVRQQPADGSTLLFSASVFSLARQVLRNAPHDPVEDFTPIARMARGPLLVLINPAIPAETLAEFVALLRRDPARYSVAISSLGAAGHLASIAFLREVGVELASVAYRGSAPAQLDVVTGQVSLLIDPVLSALPLVRAGRLKALAITHDSRIGSAPEIPTAAEAGMPGLVFGSWYGLWGPKGLPAAEVARLNGAMQDAMRDPAVAERVRQLGFEPVAEDAAAFDRFVRADVARSAELLRLANFQPE